MCKILSSSRSPLDRVVLSRVSFATSCLFLLLLIVGCCHSLPTILLESQVMKCVGFEASAGTSIRVVYDAPDMPLERTEPRYGPTYLSVNLRPAERLSEVMNNRIKDGRLSVDHLRPTNVLLTSRTGNVTHKFELDGTAAICVRSQSASAERPLRFGLAVMDGDLIDEFRPVKEGGNLTAKVASHLSTMVTELQRISHSMKSILSEADFAKERDSIFHRQTQAMDQATIFWPIVQVCVLLMTGFAQASHIVRFFKSRRIL